MFQRLFFPLKISSDLDSFHLERLCEGSCYIDL